HVEGHVARDRHDAPFLGQRLLGEAAPADAGENPVARLVAGHALTHRLDDAGDLAARGEGKLGDELVLLLDDERVGKVDPGGLHRDQDLAGTRNRIGRLLDHQRLRRSPGLAKYGFHAVSVATFDARPLGRSRLMRKADLTMTDPAHHRARGAKRTPVSSSVASQSRAAAAVSRAAGGTVAKPSGPRRSLSPVGP